MNKDHNKFRIILLIVGIIIFSLYAITTLIGSKVNEDFVNYHFLRRQVQIQHYEAADGCVFFREDKSEELDKIINEMDLAYYVMIASPVFNIYSFFDKRYRASVINIKVEWKKFFKLFIKRDSDFNKEMITALNNIDNEFTTLDMSMVSLNKNWRLFYFTILTITIIYFLFLLISLYIITNYITNDDGKGLDTVRNALIEGQEQERLRISLELHDKVAQDLFACRMIIDDITRTTEDQGIITSFNKSISLLDSSIQEVRDLSYSLRPPALQSIGLSSAIQSYIDNFTRKVGLPITFKSIGINNKKIDEVISINLYRILQETLNNTVKHAHANSIDVKLLYTYPYLLLKIDDDGIGFRYSKSEIKVKGRNNLGLPGIYERVSLLGGELVINTGKGEGTKILIKVPLEINEKM